jgi:hypothetical protein
VGVLDVHLSSKSRISISMNLGHAPGPSVYVTSLLRRPPRAGLTPGGSPGARPSRRAGTASRLRPAPPASYDRHHQPNTTGTTNRLRPAPPANYDRHAPAEMPLPHRMGEPPQVPRRCCASHGDACVPQIPARPEVPGLQGGHERETPAMPAPGAPGGARGCAHGAGRGDRRCAGCRWRGCGSGVRGGFSGRRRSSRCRRLRRPPAGPTAGARRPFRGGPVTPRRRARRGPRRRRARRGPAATCGSASRPP